MYILRICSIDPGTCRYEEFKTVLIGKHQYVLKCISSAEEFERIFVLNNVIRKDYARVLYVTQPVLDMKILSGGNKECIQFEHLPWR